MNSEESVIAKGKPIKMKGYTCRGSNSAIFTTISHFIQGQLLKKEFAPVGANSYVKSRSLFERVLLPRAENRKSGMLYSLEKMVEKHGNVQYTLRH